MKTETNDLNNSTLYRAQAANTKILSVQPNFLSTQTDVNAFIEVEKQANHKFLFVTAFKILSFNERGFHFILSWASSNTIRIVKTRDFKHFFY
jgi:hypothetical protein